MRAKTVHTTCFCFDFDECLVTTKARIRVYRNGAFVKAMNSKEFNFYKKRLGDKLDFSDFNNEEFILNAKKYKMWSVLKKISREIKTNKSSSEIYILTARSSIVKSHIFEFLKKRHIEKEIKIEVIFTLYTRDLSKC